MLFCQQCGASNSDDARFCNQCGTKIASAGEPGGPLDRTRPDTAPGLDDPDAAPPAPRVLDEPPRASIPSAPPAQASFDVSMVSLSSIGVRSRGKAWGVIAVVTLGLVGLGAGATWLAMRSPDAAPVATAEETEPPPNATEEIEIGDLLPEGAEPPDVVTGTPRPTVPSRSTPRSGGANSRGSRAPRGGSRTEPERSSGGSDPGGSANGGPSASETGGSETPDEETAGSAGSSSGRSTGGSGGTRPEPDWEAMEDEVAEEVDYEMEAYATRVRTVVRTYYARRAQSCFELATRNNESVRGTVVIGFDIQADGEIVHTEVVRNTTRIDTLGACLRSQVDRWRLPPPPEGRAPLPMQMPFSR